MHGEPISAVDGLIELESHQVSAFKSKREVLRRGQRLAVLHLGQCDRCCAVAVVLPLAKYNGFGGLIGGPYDEEDTAVFIEHHHHIRLGAGQRQVGAVCSREARRRSLGRGRRCFGSSRRCALLRVVGWLLVHWQVCHAGAVYLANLVVREPDFLDVDADVCGCCSQRVVVVHLIDRPAQVLPRFIDGVQLDFIELFGRLGDLIPGFVNLSAGILQVADGGCRADGLEIGEGVAESLQALAKGFVSFFYCWLVASDCDDAKNEQQADQGFLHGWVSPW